VSKASQVILLAEDKRQQRFGYLHLKQLGYAIRDVRLVELPAGRQSGEQWVREKYPSQVKALRARQAQTLLLVIIDADNRSVTQRADQLHQALQGAGAQGRGPLEGIAHFIPKHSIETWILALSGEPVNENQSYRFAPRVDDQQPTAATAFRAGVLSAAAPAGWLPSLQVGRDEAARLHLNPHRARNRPV